MTERLLELRDKYPSRVTEELVRDMGKDTKDEVRSLIAEVRAHPFSEVINFDDMITRAEWRQKTSRITIDIEVFAVLLCLEEAIPELLHRDLAAHHSDAFSQSTITFADDELHAVLAP